MNSAQAWRGCSVIGPIARTVADAALLLASEAQLISLAAQLEQRRQWSDQWPSLARDLAEGPTKTLAADETIDHRVSASLSNGLVAVGRR